MKNRTMHAACLLVLAAACAVPMTASAVKRDAEVDAVLTEEMNNVLAKMNRLEGQGQRIAARVRLDLDTCVPTVDLTSGFLPSNDSERFTEQMQYLDSALWATLLSLGCEKQPIFLFNGLPRNHYFPYEKPPQTRGPNAAVLTNDKLTVVSAGHGLYLHHETPEWKYQREFHNGVLEDEVTPLFANKLEQYLRERSGHQVRRTRSSGNWEEGASGQQWWKLAARYNLKQQLPDNPEIWHSLPSSTKDDREYDEDIRSRPFYANHIGAGGLIHVHTNGGPAAARGARVYLHPDHTHNVPLAKSILCYMKEVITSQPGYESFTVATAPHFKNHGENRLAEMPSVIVEAAFHTNADDARALLDPVFQAASMKGVEKGYRLHREGQPCAQFTLASLPETDAGPTGYKVLDLTFWGYPQFPVRVESTAVACPAGWKCEKRTSTHDEPNYPVRANFRCENDDAARVEWETRLVDEDGVRSNPVRHAILCGQQTAA